MAALEPVAVVDGGNGNRVHTDRFRGYDIGRQQGVLMGVVNMNMTGSICLGTMVAVGSHGESTKMRWTKTGSWAGLLVPDMVGVKVVPSGSNLT